MQFKHLGIQWGVSISGGLLWMLPMQQSYASPLSLANSPLGRETQISEASEDTSASARSAPSLVVPVVAAPETVVSPIVLAQQAPSPAQIEIRQRIDPNRDRLIQPAPLPAPAPTEQTSPIQPPTQPSQEPALPGTSQTIAVTKINVVGSTILRPGDWNQYTQPLEGRSVTLEELRQAADQITQLYLNQGYITSRAILADQTIRDGVVEIRVIEGALERIDIEGVQRLNPAYIRERIQLGTKPPLSREKLEDQLRLLKADPLFTNVEASLRPGTKLGQSVLVVRVSEAKPLEGLLAVDNFSPPSVGSVRLGGLISYRNLTGLGDSLSASYFRSTTGGSNVFDFSYRVPINPMNGTIQLRVAPETNRITDPDFEALDIRGNSQLYELSYRQPLIRTPREELALSFGFAIQNGQTFLFNDLPFGFGIGPDAEGRSRTRVLKFGQDYVKRDPQGAWAFRSQFNFGLYLFNPTINESPIPDGRFFSWLGQVQRVQRLGNDHLLIAQADLQLTPDSLLPSQQFVIGGGQSIRGFRQNARSGDNGFRISLEDRITLNRDEAGLPVLQLAPFIDFGTIWNRSDNPNRLPDQRFLAGGGIGLLWQPLPRLNIRLDYGIPFVRLRDRGGDAQDRGFYFSVNYQP